MNCVYFYFLFIYYFHSVVYISHLRMTELSFFFYMDNGNNCVLELFPFGQKNKNNNFSKFSLYYGPLNLLF